MVGWGSGGAECVRTFCACSSACCHFQSSVFVATAATAADAAVAIRVRKLHADTCLVNFLIVVDTWLQYTHTDLYFDIYFDLFVVISGLRH